MAQDLFSPDPVYAINNDQSITPCPRTVQQKKVSQSSTLDQAGNWTQDLLVSSQGSYQLHQPRTHEV